MKNKIKKLMTIFMALTIMVSSFGTVFAEDTSKESIKKVGFYKDEMHIDGDPANYDFASYFVENFEFGEDGDKNLKQSYILMSEGFIGGNNINIYLLPNNKDSGLATQYFDILNEPEAAEIIEKYDANKVIKSIKNRELSTIFVSDAFTKPVFLEGSMYVDRATYLKDLNYSDIYKNSEDRSFRIDFENYDDVYLLNIPNNFVRKTYTSVPEYTTTFGFTFTNAANEKNNAFRLDNDLNYEPSDTYGIPQYIRDRGGAEKYIIYRGNNSSVISMEPSHEIDAKYRGNNTILHYALNVPPLYKGSEKLAYGETKTEGTKNIVFSSTYNSTKYIINRDIELLKDEGLSDDVIRGLKEEISIYKNMLEQSQEMAEDQAGFLNSPNWSATPLTIRVGNVDTQTETLEFKTRRQEDPNMFVGEEKVLVEGKNGEKVTTTTYEVDEKTGELKNPVSEEKKITEPVDKVVLIGTKERAKSEIIESEIEKGNVSSEEEILEWGSEYDFTNNIVGITQDMGVTSITDVTQPKIDTKQPGNYIGKVKLGFDDGSELIVDVPVKVLPKHEEPKTDAENNSVNKPVKTEVDNKNNLTNEEKTKVKNEVKKVNPKAFNIEVKDNGDVILVYQDKSTNKLSQEDTIIEKVKEILKPNPTPNEPKKEHSKEPKVYPIHENDTKIFGKGEPWSDIEIRLPNYETVHGRTDRYGYFEVETNLKLHEYDKIYVTQFEYGKEPSKYVMEVVRRLHNYKYKDTVEEKLNTNDHYSYIVGYPNGNFGPNDKLTRSEVASIFARLSKDQTIRSNLEFKDVKPNDWFNKAVKIGVSQGFIKGYEDGTFKPYEPITRAEFASVISTYANKATSYNAFNDVNGWATGAIDKAYANGWMKGNEGTFRPDDYLTRAEAVSVINRMLNRQADREFINKTLLRSDNLIKFYKDVQPGQWYFYDVYAASWGHSYTKENGIETWTGLNNKEFTIK